MKQLRALIFPLILILATLGCDYGPMPDEGDDASMESLEEWEEFSDLDGELKFKAKKKALKAKKAAFSVEDSEEMDEFTPVFYSRVYLGESDKIDSIEIKPIEPGATCTCDCSAQNAACIAAGCPAQSIAYDKKGTCKQNGSNCGGTCECHDCYTVLGKKCHSFPVPPAGICDWAP